MADHNPIDRDLQKRISADPDFVDEIVAESTAINPAFPAIVSAVEEAKAHGLREGMARGAERLKKERERRRRLGVRYRAAVGKARRLEAEAAAYKRTIQIMQDPRYHESMQRSMAEDGEVIGWEEFARRIGLDESAQGPPSTVQNLHFPGVIPNTAPPLCLWAPNVICPKHGLIHGGLTG